MNSIKEEVTQADWRLAQSIVESDRVIRTFASAEWAELHDDGKLWIATIVSETRIQSTSELRAKAEGLRSKIEDMRFTTPDDDHQLGWTEALDEVLRILTEWDQSQ